MSEANSGAGRPLRRLRPHCLLRVFIPNEHSHHLPDAGSSHLQWHPARGSRSRLSAFLLAAGMRNRPDLLLSTHPNFSSLMWLHQRLTGIYSWCAALGIDVWTLPDGLTRCSLAHLQLLLPVSRSFEHPTPMEGAASAQPATWVWPAR
jgi:hypothetical protein